MNIYPTTDTTLPWVDFTKLTALATCPRYGIFRYFMNKDPSDGERQMPLEAGEVLHECFAGLRWHQVYSANPGVREALEAWLFEYLRRDEARFSTVMGCRGEPLHFGLAILNSSSFYDDPNDKKRTLANLEIALIHYHANVSLHLPTTPVLRTSGTEIEFLGIELPVDLTIEMPDATPWRLLGKIDGIGQRGDECVILENKTTSVMGAEWEMQWHASHQPVGYHIAARVQYGIDTPGAYVLGLNIPISKVDSGKSFRAIRVEMTERKRFEFIKWFAYVTAWYEQFKDEPTDAPMFTHSCFRYFRICEFMPVCCSDSPMEVLSEYSENEWHPARD